MVESLDAYRMAKYLREQHYGVSSTDDVLLQYCEPTPLTDEGYPIYTLKTVGAEASCVFLQGSQCSIYAARPRTCRLYPFSAGPGERGRDFEYCLCFDDNQQYHFNGGKVLVKDWLYGEYEPSVFKEQDKKQQVLNHTVSAAETALRGELSKTPAALAAFEVYQTAAGERNSAVIEQAFESGYRTAMQMLFAGLVSAPPEDHANG